MVGKTLSLEIAYKNGMKEYLSCEVESDDAFHKVQRQLKLNWSLSNRKGILNINESVFGKIARNVSIQINKEEISSIKLSIREFNRPNTNRIWDRISKMLGSAQDG